MSTRGNPGGKRRAAQTARPAVPTTDAQAVAILESIADAFFALDRDWHFTYVNRQAERLLQHARAELLGRGIWDVFPAAVGTTFYQEYSRALAQSTSVSFEGFYEPFATWFEVHAYPSESGLSVYFQDINERKRTQLELEKYRLLTAQARDIILFVRYEDGRIVEANEAAAAAYGYTREELLGLSIRDVRAVESLGQTLAQMAAAERQGLLFETVHRRRDGTTFPVEVSSRGATAGGERVLLSIVRDISERRKLEREREELLAELEAIIAALPQALVVYSKDGDGRIVQVNRAAQALFGFTTEELEQSLRERWGAYQAALPDGRPLPLDEAPPWRALQGKETHGDILTLQARGRQVWLSLSAAPFRDARGRILGAVATYSDITALHQLEEQRKDVLRLVSHDLRQPLTVVRGQAQMLLGAKEKEGAPPRELHGLRAILANTDRLGRMIAELVEASRLEAGEVQLRCERVHLPEWLPAVAQRAALPEEAPRLDVQTGDLPLIQADPERLERALQNLIGNALKYSPAGTPVCVRAEIQGREAVLSVADIGAGIPSADLPRIFERYYRAEEARQHEGLGLGLYITRLIAEAHGGRLWVESQPNQGSTFYLAVPLEGACGPA
ncbi:MAG: sensor histidine kinase [Chloroflexota bacterium]